jgi:diguanylate cyclase (GGDEF)-like protein
MDRLITLGQALAMAKSMDGLRDVLRRHLPEVVPHNGTVWALIRIGGKWDAVAGGLPGTPHRASPVLEALADRVLQLGSEVLGSPEGAEWEGHVCYPLIVGDTAVGVLGVRQPAGDTDGGNWRPVMASVAAVLAISVRNVQLLNEIQEHGVYDGLTGCFNRTHGMKVLDAELQRAMRARAPFSLIMLDLDYFKSVNDRFGHLCGDAVLTAVGKRMRELLRNSDVKCRYGGEEFLVLLPDTPSEGAMHVAESLRKELAKTSVMWNGETVSTTASVGMAVASAGELDARALIGRADAALYRAKQEGRNRVCAEKDPRAERTAQTPSNVQTFPEPPASERRRTGTRKTED